MGQLGVAADTPGPGTNNVVCSSAAGSSRGSDNVPVDRGCDGATGGLQRVTMAPRAGFLAKLVEPAFQWAAVRYKAAVGAELKKYGLRYDDLLDPTMNLVCTPSSSNSLPGGDVCVFKWAWIQSSESQ